MSKDNFDNFLEKVRELECLEDRMNWQEPDLRVLEVHHKDKNRLNNKKYRDIN